MSELEKAENTSGSIPPQFKEGLPYFIPRLSKNNYSFVFLILFLLIFLNIFPGFSLLAEENSPASGMILIKGGTFLMGQMNPHIGDKFLSSNEQPIHRSTLDSFLISPYEFSLKEALPLLVEALSPNGPNDPDGSNEIERGGSENSDLEIEKIEGEGDVIFFVNEEQRFPLLYLNKSMLSYEDSGELVIKPGFENHPLTGVTWYGAVYLCNALSSRENLPPAYNLKDWTFIEGSPGYRLPFEAEWEYAARNGEWSYRYNKKEIPGDANIADLSFSKEESKHAFEKDYDDGFPSLAPVGSFSPNKAGLFDMRGNVQEWCYDYYNDRYFEEALPRTNPSGPGEGISRVCRGGDWQSLFRDTRPTARTGWKPETAEMFLGFRMVRSVPASAVGEDGTEADR